MPEDPIVPNPPSGTDNPKGVVAVLSGSTNNSVQDGGAKGFFTGVLVFIIGIGEARLDLLTDSELATLLGLVAGGVLVGYGFWDKYVKPRLQTGAPPPV